MDFYSCHCSLFAVKVQKLPHRTINWFKITGHLKLLKNPFKLCEKLSYHSKAPYHSTCWMMMDNLKLIKKANNICTDIIHWH